MDNKNHPMSVFYWSFTRRYAFRHPLRIIKWWLNALKQRKQRAVYGWCDNDITDWYNWTAYVLAGLLDEIAEGVLIPKRRAAQIKTIASDIREAVLGEAEYEERRRLIASAFAELGEIFFDFMS